MANVDLICPICNKNYQKSTGHYNRAIKLGALLFCSQKCFGVNRRKNLTLEEKKAAKAEYDKKYRYYHLEGIKAKKAEAFQKDYKANPEKYKAIRTKRMPKHIEYCRQPEYKKYKKVYDRQFKAFKTYGPVLGELVVMILKIADLVRDEDGTKYSIRINNNTYNKSQKRKRKWKLLMQNH